VVEKLLAGFDVKLTSSNYAKIAKCSHDTAIRDLKALVEGGCADRVRSGWTQQELRAGGRGSRLSQENVAGFAGR